MLQEANQYTDRKTDKLVDQLNDKRPDWLSQVGNTCLVDSLMAQWNCSPSTPHRCCDNRRNIHSLASFIMLSTYGHATMQCLRKIPVDYP